MRQLRLQCAKSLAFVLGLLTVLDVGRDAAPLRDLSVLVLDRYGSCEEPPIGPVRGTESGLQLEGLASRVGPLPGGIHALEVIGMHQLLSSNARRYVLAQPGKVPRPLIGPAPGAVRQHDERQRRKRIEDFPKPLLPEHQDSDAEQVQCPEKGKRRGGDQYLEYDHPVDNTAIRITAAVSS